MEKKKYRFKCDAQFDDPQLGSKVVYEKGDVEEFTKKQAMYMRHILEEVQANEDSSESDE